ncbi:MAG: HAMP domain-containing histidine kinase [Planctomycetes bacterium]|jgi:two-component system phosphate regulon sensor histidine kinase PhoR|nr:HAMP domain-containing histidine kinase [Planctomycetota bacterium]
MLLLFAAAGIVVALGYLLWRSTAMEQQLRAAEHERAQALAERIVQRAPATSAAFALVPSAQRALVTADGVVAHEDTGWLAPQPSPIDRDLVVEDRLARAAAAEFVAHDVAGAERMFDELLAAALVPSMRLQVVVAAAWQARRAGAVARVATLQIELDPLLADVRPGDLARPELATAVAGALRLVAGSEPPPPWSGKLGPFLPELLVAGASSPPSWAAEHAAVVARRTLLQRLAAAWQQLAPRQPTGIAAANRDTAPIEPAELLWWQLRDDGGHDVALLTPATFGAVVAQAGRDGALLELPPPYTLLPAEDLQTTFAGVPGLRGIGRSDEQEREPPWLRPLLLGALLLVLMFALGTAIVVQLRGARAEVRAVRTQSEFLTTVTHELKTPLAGIRLLGEMLAEGRAKGREADYYRMLAGEAARLSLLIENVLDLGRLERGERAYDLRASELGELVRETLAWFAPVAERDGVVVACHDELGPVTLPLDRAAFVQALVAVLDNAHKYGRAGQRIDVTLRSSEGGRRAVLDVRDRGCGVPAAERERIFARFVRGSAHAHGSTPGVGIGLHLARTIAHKLGGELSVGDPLDGGPGARFTFCFPLPGSPAPAQLP